MVVDRQLFFRAFRVLVKQERLGHIRKELRLVYAILCRHGAVVRIHHIHGYVPVILGDVRKHDTGVGRKGGGLLNGPMPTGGAVIIFHVGIPCFNMTFREVFEAWKEEHYKEIGPRGVESYNRAFDVFQPLHDARFRSLRTADFQAVMDKYADKSHSTCSKYKQLVTQMSAWAIREEIATTSFAKFIHLPENVKKEKEIFSDSDIEKLEKNGSDTAKIILMLIYTGMRIGELFGLPLADYHETYVIGGEKTAAGRNREIPIRPEGRAYFAYFAARAKGALLLSGYTGQQVPANFRRRDYYPLLEKLKIERKTPHATRHTYASWARRSGMPTEILQKILGHADYSTTANIYVHTDISELIAAVDTAGKNSVLLTRY